MLFSSTTFVLYFLPLALLGWVALTWRGLTRIGLGWLLGCSLFFYGWYEPRYLALILGSMAVNYGLGLGIDRFKPRPRRALLIAGIVANLVLLGWFKYATWVVHLINRGAGTDFTLGTIILPLAISFFTIQQIAYLIDTYRGARAERDFLRYAVIVCFFPHLIAGPIVRLSEFLPQLGRDWPGWRRRARDLTVGGSLFVLGLFKKTVVADRFGAMADLVFGVAHGGSGLTTVDAWLGVLAYTLQIYFDFSAYSDMALGLSQMFGFKLPLNFNSPYQATSIIEFWRRWHITLSAFLRDYLYVGLGGNRRGPARRYVNLMLTMLIGGLWHGAGWTFVVWGALHGTYLIINHGWNAVRGRRQLPGVVGWALTFLAVVVAWVFFRAPDFGDAARVLRAMAGAGFAPRLGPTLGAAHAAMIFAGIAVVALAPSLQQLFRRYRVALSAPARPFLRASWKPTLVMSAAVAVALIIAAFNMDATKGGIL